jgi:hypothetical protein
MNKMDASIKSLTITGAAAEDANKSRRPIGSRKKRSVKLEEEEFLEQAKQFAVSKQPSNEVHRPSIIIPVSATPPVAPVAPVTPVAPFAAAPAVAQSVKRPSLDISATKVEVQPPLKRQEDPQYDGGARVILKPAKNPRVKLQPKGIHSPSVVHHSQIHTRKARKFRLSVGNLSHRLTRAKRVKDDTDKKSIVAIREYLVQKGVIQEKSKAPEKMLRSMYKDFMVLRDTAL